MARIAGRNGRAYLGLASAAAAAEPLAFVSQWTIDFGTGKIDVTAMGDAGKITVNGLPAQTGSLQGFYDDATVQSFTAATDGAARKFYLYPVASNSAQYFWGTINIDFNASATVDGAVEFSASWEAASTIAKVG